MKNIRDLYGKELEDRLTELGFRKFRSKQIYHHIEERGIRTFNSFTNLPAPLIKILKDEFVIGSLEPADRLSSDDGAEKVVFKLFDGEALESVYIPWEDRGTVCVSSQVGCALGCEFCATAGLGYKRNLKWWEITDQVLYFKKNRKITNVVFMGMGEPLLNIEAVLKAAAFFNDSKGFNISHTNITISTAGVIPGIKRLAELGLYKLAVSLNAPSEVRRSALMPINKKYPLNQLKKALLYYYSKTKRTITLEYVMFKDINSSPSAAEELGKFVKPLPVKLNLIAYNQGTVSHKRFNFRTPSAAEMKKFCDIVSKYGVRVFIRRSAGRDIKGGCGQLALVRLR